MSRYAVVDCVVVGHQHYGLIVRSATGCRGFVDSDYIADEPVPPTEWPAIGTELRCVVLDETRDGRLVLSTCKSLLTLVESVPDPAAALREWQVATESGESAARQRFFASPHALPLLRWALAHPSYSAARQHAEVLVPAAPAHLRTELLGPEAAG